MDQWISNYRRIKNAGYFHRLFGRERYMALFENTDWYQITAEKIAEFFLQLYGQYQESDVFELARKISSLEEMRGPSPEVCLRLKISNAALWAMWFTAQDVDSDGFKQVEE